MKSSETNIGINGFTMVFGLKTIGYQWYCNGFGPATIGHDGFSMVFNGS